MSSAVRGGTSWPHRVPNAGNYFSSLTHEVVHLDVALLVRREEHPARTKLSLHAAQSMGAVVGVVGVVEVT